MHTNERSDRTSEQGQGSMTCPPHTGMVSYRRRTTVGRSGVLQVITYTQYRLDALAETGAHEFCTLMNERLSHNAYDIYDIYGTQERLRHAQKLSGSDHRKCETKAEN